MSHEDGGQGDRERPHRRRLTEGWLIEKAGQHEPVDERRYLQIGTGQWCGAIYATLFPEHDAAVTYAVEFGYVVGKTANVVRYDRGGR